MLQMTCSVQLADGVSTKKLTVRLGLNKMIIEDVIQGSLRSLGYVVRNWNDD